MTDRTGSSAVDRSERPGNVGLVLALAIAVVGALAAYYLAPSTMAPRFTILALALFGVAGVFFLFAYAVGLIQFSNRIARNDVTKLIADTSGEGLLVTEGRIADRLRQRSLYGAVRRARRVRAVRSSSGCSPGRRKSRRRSTGWRRRRARGTAHTEDLRLSPPLTGEGAVGWYRIRVRPLPTTGRPRLRSGPSPT